MTEMTKERLAEIAAREQNATEGPWRISKRQSIGANCDDNYSVWKDTEDQTQITDIAWLADTYRGNEGPNALFIAHAREDIPFLLSEHKRLSEEVDRLKVAYTNIGNSVLVMSEEFQDEGDRVYLNSTNDAEVFRRLGAKYWDWKMEQEKPKS